METKLNYEAPEIEIVYMAVEQGFAISGDIDKWDDQGQIDDNVF